MGEKQARTRERYLTRREVSEWLGIPARTLARWAYVGSGPPFFRIGRWAMYREDEVERWLETRRAGGAPEPHAARRQR